MVGCRCGLVGVCCGSSFGCVNVVGGVGGCVVSACVGVVGGSVVTVVSVVCCVCYRCVGCAVFVCY